jgi:hypothetical protein
MRTRRYGSMTLAAIAAALSWTAQPADAQDRTYNKPLYRENRLDWCLTWGNGCGKPAADNFCNRRRYERARVFRAEVVGRREATRLIGSNEVCSGQDFCTAFAYITCESPIPSERVFASPVWNGHRLDVCLQWGANCGKPAADAFCRKNGFSESLHAESDAEAGRGTTRVIGTGQVCSGSFCRGFNKSSASSGSRRELFRTADSDSHGCRRLESVG